MNLSGTFASVIVGWVLINGFMFFAQPGMLFFPTARLDATPGDWGMDYQEVRLRTEDGVGLHGWFIPGNDSPLTLLFFHGNAGNISHRGESIGIFHRLGLNVFILDYRGYGLSEGSPSEEGLYRDARAAWQWLTTQRGFPPQRVILFGRSLGGAVAAKLASEVSPGALILESSFSSARDAAHSLFPLLSRLVWLRYRLDAAARVRMVRAPVLVLHSPDDEIIPYRLGRRLFAAAPEPKRFVDLDGGHNNGFLVSEPRYSEALDDFLADLPGYGSARRVQPR
jgi:fermentation-respiration switch protein FrsA (DUF1100 family)